MWGGVIYFLARWVEGRRGGVGGGEVALLVYRV